MLDQNRASNTGFRAGTEKFLLKGLVYCGHCGCAMAPSFAYSKGRKYYYYRCLVNNDPSKGKCPIGAVNAKALEDLIVKKLQFLAESPEFVDEVVEEAIREEREEGERLKKKKQALAKRLQEVEGSARKMMNLLEGLEETDPRFAFILQKLKELGEERDGLKKEIELLEFKINEVENNYLNAESLKANFKYFKEVFEHLTPQEKYDLLHLLIKRIVYYGKEVRDGQEATKIKLELWDIGPISSGESFTERIIWLPGQDSNLQPTG
ncbi:zinc ribbon domain-containing protein [Thermosulfurimonas sp. F29]|uniref:recombinase zinc beta ribbon domain-containing protein n=1 Tax=Thermosulfurimonas sp. F29 TaxID=2867247 RepID=UPI001C82E515|nr:zinc ribbon domain-containing protein [Thermosulfurimonas sp. F29]